MKSFFTIFAVLAVLISFSGCTEQSEGLVTLANFSGDNLILNPDFESSSSGYTSWSRHTGGSDSMVLKQDQKHGGSNSVWFGSDGGTAVLR